MISSATCAVPASVYSNVLTLTAGTVTGIPSTPGEGSAVLVYPNPASQFISLDSLKLSDQWQSLQIVAADGQVVVSALSIRGLQRVQVPLARLQKGAYIVVLQRRNKANVYKVFMKQ